MKKNGFTLVELLAVILIISAISLIIVFAVGPTIEQSGSSLSDIQKKNIEEAAKSYYIKEGMDINDECVSLSELIEKGYIEGNSVIDPETDEEMTGYVKITYASNQYSYKYQKESCE